MRLVVVAVLAIAGLAVIETGAADDQPEFISIEPPNPTSDDEVSITIKQITPCIIEDAALNPSHSIEGNKITLTIGVDQDLCASAVSGFTLTESIGKLEPGTYDVEAEVDLTRCCRFVDLHHLTFAVTGPTPSPEPSAEALPSTGSAPLEQEQTPLALVGVVLGALGAAAIVSRAMFRR